MFNKQFANKVYEMQEIRIASIYYIMDYLKFAHDSKDHYDTQSHEKWFMNSFQINIIRCKKLKLPEFITRQ